MRPRSISSSRQRVLNACTWRLSSVANIQGRQFWLIVGIGHPSKAARRSDTSRYRPPIPASRPLRPDLWVEQHRNGYQRAQTARRAFHSLRLASIGAIWFFRHQQVHQAGRLSRITVCLSGSTRSQLPARAIAATFVRRCSRLCAGHPPGRIAAAVADNVTVAVDLPVSRPAIACHAQDNAKGDHAPQNRKLIVRLDHE